MLQGYSDRARVVCSRALGVLILPVLLSGCGQAAVSGRLNRIEKAFDQELHLLSARLPAAKVGQPYRAELVAKGGAAPYEWRIVYGSLPQGLGLDAVSGVISGVPASAGEASFVVYVRARPANKESVVQWRVATNRILVAAPEPPSPPQPEGPPPVAPTTAPIGGA